MIASPLRAIASFAQKTQGSFRQDRILYGVYNILLDLFGSSPLFGSPPFDVLVDTTYDIYELSNIVDPKSKAFMQQVGDIVRNIDQDILINKMERNIAATISRFENDTDSMNSILGIVVSDVRLPKEAETIKEYPNSFLVQLLTSVEDLSERRSYLSSEEKTHVTEMAMEDIPSNLFDLSYNTSELSTSIIVKSIEEYVKKGLV